MAGTSASVPQLWKSDDPGIADAEFTSYISLEERESFHPAETQCKAWKDAPNPETWSAFGDRGTTAMVSAYGDLIQFGTYTGQGRSGMFTVDRRSTSEPYMVESRTEDLHTCSGATFNESYGLNIHEIISVSEDQTPSNIRPGTPSSAASSKASPDASPEHVQIFPYTKLPQLQYVNYRWPRFQSAENSGRSNITTQWMVHDGVVMQQVRVVNTSPTKLHVRFTVDLKDSMWIRDLEHMDVSYDFNESRDNHAQLFGPHNYSWVLTRELGGGQAVDKADYEEETRDTGIEAVIKDETDHKGETELKNETESMGESMDRTIKHGKNGTVAVIVSVLQDRQLVKIVPPINEDSPLFLACEATLEGITEDNSMGPQTQRSKTSSSHTDVVIAYKMIILPSSKIDWKDFIIPASTMNVDKILSSEPFNDNLNVSSLSGKPDENPESSDENTRVAFNLNVMSDDKAAASGVDQESGTKEHQKQPKQPEVPDHAERASSHIEFVVRRQLEHILSNCSIPLKPPRLYKDGDYDAYWTGEAVPVALTCGDISFHRITSSASFFAFRFLLEVARRIQNSPYHLDAYGQFLLRRITETCRGHIIWLMIASRSTSDCFSANYWVTGKIISTEKSPSYAPSDRLTDTAFQITKVGTYIGEYPDKKDDIQPSFISTCLSWLGELEKQDQRACFAWPHAFEDDVNLFRLDDHVWVWTALKSIGTLGLWPDLLKKSDRKDLARKFADRDVQREILRRFTTQNDVLRKRMLATTRSCRETRFLFHARDTVLFYSLDWGFALADDSFHDLWTSTIQVQGTHEENQETRWDNALRYALAVQMGCRGYSINKRTPEALVHSSLTVLMRSSSPNGLFAGQLDETTKEPVLFYRESDRDTHLHATFEIPFLLLMEAVRISEVPLEDRGRRASLAFGIVSDSDGQPQMLTQQANVHVVGGTSTPVNAPVTMEILNDEQITRAAESIHRRGAMKKVLPLNHFMDSTHVVEIEEEWLYNYPTFFSNDKPPSTVQIQHSVAQAVVEGVDVREPLKKLLSARPEIAANIVRDEQDVRTRLCRDIPWRTLQRPDSRSVLKQILLKETTLRHAVVKATESTIPAKIRGILLGCDPTDLDSIKPDANVLTPVNTNNHHPGRFSRTSSSPQFEIPLISISSRRNTTPLTSKAENLNPAMDTVPEPAFTEFVEAWDTRKAISNVLSREPDILVRCIRDFDVFRQATADIVASDNEFVARAISNSKEVYDKLKDLLTKGSLARLRVIRQAMLSYLEKSVSEPTYSYHFDTAGSTWLTDVRKRSQGKRNRDSDCTYRDYSNLGLWYELINVRRPVNAKKRFITSSSASLHTALVCYFGSPEVEQRPLSLFFDRHSNYELYFFDDTTAHKNTWETELHLSFYQICRSRNANVAGLPKSYEEPFLGRIGDKLTKASMSFRVFGDFFDRYWTCHFLEYTPNEGPLQISKTLLMDDKSLRQRKVLELHLFEQILVVLCESTREIYEEVREELGVRDGAISSMDLNSDDYFSSRAHWQECQQTLHAVEDQLEHIIAVVVKWEARVKDRGSEKPRWTRNDERKYGGHIKKRLSSSNDKIRDMRRLHVDMNALKEQLMREQDRIRNDLSLRGAENIRFFTYVTVVFLPLGFASSIFSMSQVPNASLIGSMVGLAAVAFLMTLMALVNAENLGIAISTVSRHIAGFSEITMERSRVVRKRKQAKIAGSESHGASVTPMGLHAAKQKLMKRLKWHIRFWAVYLLVELPVERIALAYQSMKENRDWTWSACLSVIIAFILLPFCILIWLIRVAAYNGMDLIWLLWIYVERSVSRGEPDDELFSPFLDSLLRPEAMKRPFKVLTEKRDEKPLDETQNNQHKPGTGVEAKLGQLPEIEKNGAQRN